MDPTREKYYDLIGYMVSSAKGLVTEPKMYGPLRLVDATGRLIAILEEQGVADDFLVSLRSFIDEGRLLVMTDEDEFVSFLGELVVKMATVTLKDG